jgi:gamma-glutamylcyclotransferase (GGCT)/AIG2-like uncharacterized protein YtfP
MADAKPFNLFVYGTLMNPSVFRAVLGKRMVFGSAEADGLESLHARNAVLDGFHKVSPDNSYLYAVKEPHGRIRGYLIGPLDDADLSRLRHYEGRNYRRRRVSVHTAYGDEQALVFIANARQLDHVFGYAFDDKFKQEVLLGEKIDKALQGLHLQQGGPDAAGPGRKDRDKPGGDDLLARRAIGELHALTIRDIKRRHFDVGGISDYAIRMSLMDEPLRDFSRIVGDEEAAALAPHYLRLVIRQVIFNQFEERLRKDFRYELDGMNLASAYYERTVSSLAALGILNGASEMLDALVNDGLANLDFPGTSLVEYVRWAIVAADSIYSTQLARAEMEFIAGHTGRGHIPLGAELEFSNIGHDVIRDPGGDRLRDLRYDGFLYFADFALDILTWKLGGHIDDHHEKSSTRPRRGFFEVALGSLSVGAGLSKPITNDPWMLNRFIHEARRFYNIAPHSVHISLQLRARPLRNRLLPLAAMKCLFAIAGDPVVGDDGRIIMNRLTSDETVRHGPAPSMLFSEISRRRSIEESELHPRVRTGTDRGRYVQQFRFLRLGEQLNYEPIVLALKGLQVNLRPGNFMTATQYETSRQHKELFDTLSQWGSAPRPIAGREIDTFLKAVRAGLMAERQGRAVHSRAYIRWAISELADSLQRFNSMVIASRSLPRKT